MSYAPDNVLVIYIFVEETSDTSFQNQNLYAVTNSIFECAFHASFEGLKLVTSMIV